MVRAVRGRHDNDEKIQNVRLRGRHDNDGKIQHAGKNDYSEAVKCHNIMCQSMWERAP